MLLVMANGQNEVRMTLRVSLDSGRTWGPLTAVRASEAPVVADNPGRYPPCVCPRCSRRAGKAIASFGTVS